MSGHRHELNALRREMQTRTPIAAGSFYPADAGELAALVQHCLQSAEPSAADRKLRPWGLMLPHAGYVYSGSVAGATLAGVELPETLVVLCPNHTGRGQPLSIWPEGQWQSPLGAVPVDDELAMSLASFGCGLFSLDSEAHLAEHAIEVLVPFLQTVVGQSRAQGLRLVPVCVGLQNPQVLRAAGQALAAALTQWQQEGRSVGVVVSSDMNHFEDQVRTIEKDALALDRALACDPDGLLQVVAQEQISMCGAGPLALALYAAHVLGRPRAELVAHDTSARASGDTRRVVGYAGLHLFVD